MKALLENEHGEVLAYSHFDGVVNACDGDTITVTWVLNYSNLLICAHCGKELKSSSKMQKVGNTYYHVCSLRCRLFTALKQAIE
jgi:hypothetical protein